MNPTELVAPSTMDVENEDECALNQKLSEVNLPSEFEALYRHVGHRSVSFSIERVMFYALRDLVSSPSHIHFAEEIVSATRTKKWTYCRVDGVVTSDDSESLTVRGFVSQLCNRELRQRAMNHLRYSEKCVNGIYCPTPELHADD